MEVLAQGLDVNLAVEDGFSELGEQGGQGGVFKQDGIHVVAL